MRVGCFFIVAGILTGPAVAEPITGPVIPGHGPVYYVPEEPQSWPAGQTLKAAFDIAGAPEAPLSRWPNISTTPAHSRGDSNRAVCPGMARIAVRPAGGRVRTHRRCSARKAS